MSGSFDIRPTVTAVRVEQLVQWVWDGKVRIPDFERPLRWQRGDVIRLFDSIVRGYPVGTLLFWRRPGSAGMLQLGALRVAAAETPDALWVVDGQQRIISLANALNPDAQSDQRFRISYDLRGEVFIPTPREVNFAILPLPVLFDPRALLHWFRNHPEASDYLEDAYRVGQSIRDFVIPVTEISGDQPEVVREIFERINTSGRALTRAEVFGGLFASERGDGAATLDVIAQNISDELEFGLIDNDTILQAILARRAPDVHRQIRDEFSQEAQAFIEFPGEDRDTAYLQGGEAIRRAVLFLQTVGGVPHFTFLPFKYTLVVLTRLFAHYPDIDERNLQLIRRWFWRAVLVGPEIFRGGTSGAVRALNRAVGPRDLEGSIQRLLELIPSSAARMPDLKHFRSNEARTKILLCSWWSQEPRSLIDGQSFGITDLYICIDSARTPLDAVLRVFSRYSVRRELGSWAANRILYPEAIYETGPVESILALPSDQRPMTGPDWVAALASHNITIEMAASVQQGEVDGFLTARQEAVEKQFDTFLRHRCEWEFEDTPPLDSLILDDENEAEELSDDDSS